MLSQRIALALDEGLIAAPVTVIGPGATADLSGLPSPVTVIEDRQPDHAALARRHEMTAEIGPAATVVLAVPREKARFRDWMARAAATGATVLVDGQKTDGIDSLLKEARAKGAVTAVIAKAHGKLFATRPDPAAWPPVAPGRVDGFEIPPGAFSADGPDPASVALAEVLPALAGHVVDLGAGWGYLARAVLASEAVRRLDLVEADRPSLAAALANAADPRARAHWADATAWRPDAPADHVVMNPPFHRGRAGDPALGQSFIRTAAASLAPRGTLWMVANRHLPYSATLDETFAEIATLPGPPGFHLTRATRPRRPR